MLKKLIYIFLFISLLFGSGGYDNGTATGKGRFKFDLTWNPFNKINFGQSYVVGSYGITDKFDFHGYISTNKNNYSTYYFGLFYQFYNNNIHLATAFGIRKKINGKLNDVFLPQLLYTIPLSKKIDLGGSIVNVYNLNDSLNKGTAIDIGLYYKLNYKTNYIQNISLGISVFHPVTWSSKTFFVPTYSVDLHFK